MKESTAFLILSWLSTPQSESGLESVTTYKNLGVYTNSIRLSWSLAFFNDGRDQHLTYSLAKFLPMVLHPLSYWSLQYNSIGIDILLPPPPVFFWAVLFTGGYANVHITSSTDIPAQEKRSRQPCKYGGLWFPKHVHMRACDKNTITRSGPYLLTRSGLFLCCK